MRILNKIIPIDELVVKRKNFFSDMSMMKAVVDIDRGIVAVNAELHSDLEQILLENEIYMEITLIMIMVR